MNNTIPLSVHIALRYLRAKKSNSSISFFSVVSLLGISLGLASIIVVISVMNGFEKEMHRRILGMLPHISVENRAKESRAVKEECYNTLTHDQKKAVDTRSGSEPSQVCANSHKYQCVDPAVYDCKVFNTLAHCRRCHLGLLFDDKLRCVQCASCWELCHKVCSGKFRGDLTEWGQQNLMCLTCIHQRPAKTTTKTSTRHSLKGSPLIEVAHCCSSLPRSA